MNSTQQLYQFFKYYSIGNPRVLRQNFADSCANDSCITALEGLLDTLTGDFEQQANNCDLLVSLYDGYPSKGYF